MILHDLHPFIRVLVVTILCMMIGGGTGYILCVVNETLDKQEARKKQEASKPIRSKERHIDIKL